MSFDKCLRAALEAKKITGKKADEAIKLYDGTVDEFMRKGMAESEARTAAAKQVTDHIVWEKAEQKRRTLKQIQKQAEVQQNIDKFIEKHGLENAGKAGEAFFQMDDRASYTTYGVRKDRRASQLYAMIDNILMKFEPKVAGLVRPKAGLRNIVKELYGIETGDAAAREMADAWRGAADLARKMFVRAGGSMPKRADWRLPQHQDPARVRKQGKQSWVADHMEWVDWDAMRNPQTGHSILPEERESVLGYVWDTISSEGWAHQRPGTAFRKSIGNQLDSHRFLVFKDADTWMKMHEKYGSGSVFDAMTGYIDRMASDIAMMETFGPNPFSTVELIKSTIQNRVGKDPKLVEKTKSSLNLIDDYYAVTSRSTSGSENNAVVNAFAATHNILVSSALGSATLLSISDFFTTALTKAFNKMPGTASIRTYLKLMNPLSSVDRQAAIRAGLGAENATSLAFAQMRFIGDMMGPRVTRRLSDSVLRASLLSPHTQSLRWAIGMDMMGAWADDVGKAFDQLAYKDALARNGITAEDWDVLRGSELYDHKGGKWLRPDDVLKRTDLDDKRKMEVADKFMEFIMREREYAVPTASLRARVALTGATRADTMLGQLARSFGLFKNFAVTVMFLHGRRGLQRETRGGKAAYLAAFAAGMTTMGALAVQAREIVKGNDPMDMTDSKFWGKAALAGGGMGIWGDFLFADLNRFGGGPTETAAGPVVSFLGDTLNLSLGNLVQLATGEKTNFPAELVNYMRYKLPGQNIWYIRAIAQRMLWDQVQKEADPKAYQKFRRQMSNLRRETGQEQWWPSGSPTPRRAPDIKAAFGQ